eukprot:CAMPEP_0182798696 /NCGR_PEP_ID=MMETSP0006_2-20121128/1484_1 /TAXON_ID=97485 /ORGANISM="Prymnesium parvum, Strain Texoma1" /LENGTH=43 /DNA_ID= /DNA_START= /DNA_END= /DNA_ORIENTATION=
MNVPNLANGTIVQHKSVIVASAVLLAPLNIETPSWRSAASQRL